MSFIEHLDNFGSQSIYKNQIEINILDSLDEALVTNELNQPIVTDNVEKRNLLNRTHLENWDERAITTETFSESNEKARENCVWLDGINIKDWIDTTYSSVNHYANDLINEKETNKSIQKTDDSGEIVVNHLQNISAPHAPPLIIRQFPREEKREEHIFLCELPPRAPRTPGTKIIQIPGKLLPPPPRKLICERLPELPKKPQNIYIERWLPHKDRKRRVVLKPKPSDPTECRCKIKNLIVSWEKIEISNVKNVIKNMGVEKTDPVDYVATYGPSLVSNAEFPEIVNEIRKEQEDNVVLASEQNVSYYMELEGDIQGIVLIDDLEKEGLGDFKQYLKDLINELKPPKKTKIIKNYEKQIDIMEKLFKFSDSDLLEMNKFFKSFDQTVSLEELDSFLLKLGSHLATAEPRELAALFQQLTKHVENKNAKEIEMSNQAGESSDFFFHQMASQLMSGARNNELAGLAVAGTALLGGSLYYYLNNGLKRDNSIVGVIDHRDQTREVKGRDDGARISNLNKSDILLSNCFQDGKTLYELFLRGRKASNDGDFLGSRKTSKEPFKWLKYSQVNEIAEKIGSAFIHFGLQPAKETCVGIYAKNRAEWVITETACNAYSFVTIPLYDTLGSEAIDFILMQSELRIVACDDSEKAMHLMKTKSSLEHIIVFDEIKEEVRARAEELNIKVYSFEEVQEIGKENLKRPIPPNQNDLATICYTSGTTGQPKGAMITHNNIVSIGSSMYMNLEHVMDKKNHEQHRYLSYLPLAHMFERVSQSFVISIGGKIAFYQGDIKLLSEDLRDLKPTIFCTVPRLLNRIYSKVTDNLDKAPFYKKLIFRWAFANKEKEVLNGIVRSDSVYDFVFKQIRESLGGCVKFMLTGSAPISPEVLHFLRVACGCHVLEGYGATETGGASGVQIPGESTVGNVGPPFACSMYKLIDVPTMDLVVKRDNKGEICVFGTNIFRGYFKDEEKTREALDSEGWYHTGDIGSWETNGTLKIVDRVKNIFKLQQGEYVAPEKIENIYVRSRYVSQVFVYGNSYKSSVIGVIVPEESILLEWARNNNLENLSFKELCSNPEVKKLIMNDLDQQAKLGGLKGFEKVKDIYLHDDLFSIENGLLTPTMKSKRNDLQKKFQNQLDEMNSHLD